MGDFDGKGMASLLVDGRVDYAKIFPANNGAKIWDFVEMKRLFGGYPGHVPCSYFYIVTIRRLLPRSQTLQSLYRFLIIPHRG